jgi:hypothetical protein
MQSETKLNGSLKHCCKLKLDTNKHDDLNHAFTNHGEEGDIYPLTTIEIQKHKKKIMN